MSRNKSKRKLKAAKNNAPADMKELVRSLTIDNDKLRTKIKKLQEEGVSTEESIKLKEEAELLAKDIKHKQNKIDELKTLLEEANKKLKKKVTDFLSDNLKPKLNDIIDKTEALQAIVTSTTLPQLDAWEKFLQKSIDEEKKFSKGGAREADLIKEIKQVCEGYKKAMTVKLADDIFEMRPNYWNGVETILNKISFYENSGNPDAVETENDSNASKDKKIYTKPAMIRIIKELKRLVVKRMEQKKEMENDDMFKDLDTMFDEDDTTVEPELNETPNAEPVTPVEPNVTDAEEAKDPEAEEFIAEVAEKIEDPEVAKIVDEVIAEETAEAEIEESK